MQLSVDAIPLCNDLRKKMKTVSYSDYGHFSWKANFKWFFKLPFKFRLGLCLCGFVCTTSFQVSVARRGCPTPVTGVVGCRMWVLVTTYGKQCVLLTIRTFSLTPELIFLKDSSFSQSFWGKEVAVSLYPHCELEHFNPFTRFKLNDLTHMFYILIWGTLSFVMS